MPFGGGGFGFSIKQVQEMTLPQIENLLRGSNDDGTPKQWAKAQEIRELNEVEDRKASSADMLMSLRQAGKING